MSKLGQQLEALRIFNTHGILERFGERGTAVAVAYHPGESRRCECDKSIAFSPFFKTDPKAAWYDHGQKVFIGKRSESLPQALAWASETYGIREWTTCPTDVSAKIPKYILDRAKAAVQDKGDAPVARKRKEPRRA